MIQTESEQSQMLLKKLEILHKIHANTKAQIRFIRQRKLKGLNRLLDERAQYLQVLSALEEQVNFSKFSGMTGNTADEAIRSMIAMMQEEIVRSNDEALQMARDVGTHILADIQRVRAMKTVNASYCTRWRQWFTGQQFDQKG